MWISWRAEVLREALDERSGAYVIHTFFVSTILVGFTVGIGHSTLTFLLPEVFLR